MGLGTASIPALVQHARRLGYGALALTDVENLHGQVQFHALCRAAGMQPISGIELHLAAAAVPFTTSPTRLVLLAPDRGAYGMLCQLVTRRRARSRPSHFPPEDIVGELQPGLFMLAEDPNLLWALVTAFGTEWVRALVSRPRQPADSERERELLETAHKLDVRVLADVDASLLEEHDRELERLVGAVHRGAGRYRARASASDSLAAAGRTGGILHEASVVARLFGDLPHALRESVAISAVCELDLLRPLASHAALSSADAGVARGEGSQTEAEGATWLEQRCRERLAQRAGASRRRARYERRLAEELAAIRELNLVDLFSSVAALAERARHERIPLTARGSAVSSLALHLLGLSAIDPVEHGLYFERFASAARRSAPDVDLDVASRRRDELVAWLLEQRGPGRGARLCAVHTFQRRSAYREGLKALGAPAQVIERLLRALPPDELPGDARTRAAAQVLARPWRARLPLLSRLIGMPRHIALHPGGVVLTSPSHPMPLERTPSGAIATQYDAASAARLGLPKLDLLGSYCLDELDAALASLREQGHPLQRPSDIPLEDPATLRLIDRAETLGCFQLESPALRSVLRSLPIRSLRDVMNALAIVRPGPASGHAKQTFLERARGASSGVPWPAPLEERLRATHGMLLYEEDILVSLATFTGIPLDAAEALRVRLVERGDDGTWLEAARARFIRRAEQRGTRREDADRIWSDIVRFARYSFNRAHAASQALLAYQMAYLLCHAPVELGCALLNHHGGMYPRRVIAAELGRRKVRVLPPSLVHSGHECSIERAEDGPDAERAIRVGLGLIRSVRNSTRARLLHWSAEHRAGGSFEDLMSSARPRAAELRALVWSGACDELLGLTEMDYPWVHEAVLRGFEEDQPSAARELVARARQRLPREPAHLVDRYRRLARVQHELRYLEMHVSDHPMRVLRSEAESHGCVHSQELQQHVGERVRFAGVVAAARSVPLGTDDATQFLTLEDEHGLIEARILADAYDRLHPMITTPGPFLAVASVEERLGVVYLALEELMPFHRRAELRSSSTGP